MKNSFLICLFLVVISAGCQSEHLTKKSTLDPERLALVDQMLDKAVENNEIPGAVVLIAKDNQIVYKKAFGVKDPETGAKFQTDDIFRIASMTKAITSLGVIMLWERGLFDLDDPIENYIPEFKGIGILKDFNKADSTYTTKPATKKITIRHLLTHTSGMGYDFIDWSPAMKAIFHKEKQKFMKNGTVGLSDQAVSIGETIRHMAKLPLHFEPGKKFSYAIGIDVLGYLIELASGKSLDQFFKEEIFTPLEMNDTYFYIPDEKASRLVGVYTKKEDQWVPYENKFYNVNYPIEGAKEFFSGGAGLSSTAEDYFKFLSVFLNGGRYKDKQIIGKMTNELLQLDQLPRITSNTKSSLGHGLISGIVRQKDLTKGASGS